MSVKGFSVNGVIEKYDYNALENKPSILDAPVQSVNGKTGDVVLNAADVGAGTYSKPSGGIPKTDLASAVQTSLDKADTAYQKPSGGIPASDLAQGVIPTVPTKTSDLTNDSGFINATVAAAVAPVQSVNGQTGAVTVQAATDAQVSTAVNTWCGNNIAQETGYVLDSSLTMSNAAAPAKKVGELKSAVNQEVYLLQENIGQVNYYKATDVALVDVTGAGAYRAGCDCGELPPGNYILTYKQRAGSTSLLYLTTAIGSTYTQTQVTSSPFTLTLSASAKVIVRSNAASLSNWDFYDVKLVDAGSENIADAVASLKEAITPLPDLVLEVDGGDKTLEIEDLQVGYYSSNTYNSSTAYRWGTVDCTEVVQAVVDLSAIADSANIQTLNVNKGFIRSIGNWQTGIKTISLADNEKYLRISARTNDVPKIVVTGTLKNYIAKSVETLESNMMSFKNIIGLSKDVFYPVDLKLNDNIALRTKDGTNLGESVHINLYDENFGYISQINFQANSSGRIIPITTSNIKYLMLLDTPPKEIQIEINSSITEYEPYALAIKKKEIYDSLLTINKETFISDYNVLPIADDVQKIITKLSATSGNTEQFLFFTDPHLAQSSGGIDAFEAKTVPWINRLEAVYNATAMSFCLCGADWLNNQNTVVDAMSKLAYIDGFMRKKFSNYLPMVGNHDTNYQGASKLSNAQIMATTQRFREKNKNYYKYQAPTSTIYVFDTGVENEALSTYQYEQLAWFGSSLLSDTAAHIILTAHILFYDTNMHVEPLTNKVLEIAQAYNARTTITVNGTTYDYSSSTGKISFFVSGHTHTDKTGTINDIPYIITKSFGYQNTLYAYDALIADWDAKKLYAVRIGDGDDRTIDIL